MNMPLQLAHNLIKSEIEDSIKKLEKIRESAIICVYSGIHSKLVDSVSQQINSKRKNSILKNKLDVILHTSGGDPDAAFNIGRLLQRSAKEVNVIIPRKAKSAGTLLACCADQIVMLETSELGPLDIQITQMDKDRQPTNVFSALAVRAAEDKIKKELNDGNDKYAELLAKRMPDAIIATELQGTLEISKKYLRELLYNRMFKKSRLNDNQKDAICKKLVEGYSHHGYVIDIHEAKNELNLNVALPPDKEQKHLIDKIHQLHLKHIELMNLLETQINRK